MSFKHSDINCDLMNNRLLLMRFHMFNGMSLVNLAIKRYKKDVVSHVPNLSSYHHQLGPSHSDSCQTGLVLNDLLNPINQHRYRPKNSRFCRILTRAFPRKRPSPKLKRECVSFIHWRSRSNSGISLCVLSFRASLLLHPPPPPVVFWARTMADNAARKDGNRAPRNSPKARSSKEAPIWSAPFPPRL